MRLGSSFARTLAVGVVMLLQVGCGSSSDSGDGRGGSGGAKAGGGNGGTIDGGGASASGGTSSGGIGGSSTGGAAGSGGSGSGGTGTGGTGGAATVHSVMVSSDIYSPANMTIAVGDTVRWVWQDDNHSVTSGVSGIADGKFCSPSDVDCANAATSNTGFTYDHTFSLAGTFAYFCQNHWDKGMTGSVVVQ